MKQIYLFSGVGADYRVFQYLDFTGYETTFIDWIPNKPDEDITAYAKRLLPQITAPNATFIGLSFGGIMAAEVAKLVATEKLILLASVKTCHELPPSVQKPLFPFYKLIPGWMVTRPNFIINWLFGTEGARDRDLLAAILHDTDPAFLKWALAQISQWKNLDIHKNTVHIHGTADRLFPYKYVNDATPVKGGGHFMTVNKAAELSALLRMYL